MTTFERKIKYRFVNSNLLTRALTHKSYHNENLKKSIGNNERLEFLGDAVLDLVLSDYLMRMFLEVDEGDLSKLRASLVNEQALFEIAEELEVSEFLKLGKGESGSGGTKKPRLLASALEALLGAVFIDGGFNSAYKVVVDLFDKKIEAVDLSTQYKLDYKTRLQELVQESHKQTPSYKVINEEGPDHDKNFIVQVLVDVTVLGQGEGNSKKLASQEAARLALEGL